MICEGSKAKEVERLVRLVGLSYTHEASMLDLCCKEGLVVVDPWCLSIIEARECSNVLLFEDPLLFGLELVKVVDGVLREVLIGIDPGYELHTLALLVNGRLILTKKAQEEELAKIVVKVVELAQRMRARSIRVRVGYGPPSSRVLKALRSVAGVLELVPEHGSSRCNPPELFRGLKLDADERAALNIALRKGLKVSLSPGGPR